MTASLDKVAGASAVAGVFPVTRSILSRDALMAEVRRGYRIPAPVSCQLLRAAWNDTYLLRTVGEAYIVRVYRTQWRSPSAIAFELELLVHLSAAGVAVAAPLPDREGRWMRALQAPEGLRQAVLFPYVRGEGLEWTETDCRRAGETLARLHGATDEFASDRSRPDLDLTSLIDRSVDAVQPFLTDAPADAAYLGGLAGRLRARAEAVTAGGLSWGICHGDYGLANLLRDGNDRVTVLDFDQCGRGWRALDLAPFWGKGEAEGRTNYWEAFVTGYEAVRPLAATELAAVPLFRVLRHLYMLRMFAENGDDWGIMRIYGHKLTGWLDYFRQWEAGGKGAN